MEHPFVQWLILGVSVMAFFLVVKILAARLPGSGFLGAAKQVIASA